MVREGMQMESGIEQLKHWQGCKMDILHGLAIWYRDWLRFCILSLHYLAKKGGAWGLIGPHSIYTPMYCVCSFETPSKGQAKPKHFQKLK